MAGTNDSTPTSVARVRQWLDAEDVDDPPFAVTVALGVVASVLVGLSVVTAFEFGYTTLGLGYLAAVVVFVVTLGVFEAGRRLGVTGR